MDELEQPGRPFLAQAVMGGVQSGVYFAVALLLIVAAVFAFVGTARRFANRAEAGRLLAELLRRYAGRDDVIVLALPRGGVPVGFEVARALNAPLDVFVVRKLGVPGHEELAFGAIATGGTRVLNEPVVEALGLPGEAVEAVAAREQQELQRRERAYRGDRPPPDLSGRTVILVDDGLATGATMLAAIHAVRQEHPARVVVAVPVADVMVCEDLRREADEVVCLHTPSPFRAVGMWYEDFSQVTDEEVRDLLEHARPQDPPAGREPVRPLTGASTDYDPLLVRAADARLVLIGEASHGTREFYRERAEITKRLIAEEALRDFRRFPAWMWRNTEVEEFVGWMRDWNDGVAPGAPMLGFYGLDLYSLHRSMEAVIEFLEEADPDAALRAIQRYSCFDHFDHFGRDPQVYGYETGLGGAEPCEQMAVEQLMELQDREAELIRRTGGDEDAYFFTEQNARLVVNAEQYYRAAFRGGYQSWNLRDSHMAATLYELVDYLGRRGGPPKLVVWAHNSHLGDARATEMGQGGELNLGQLVRERSGDDALLVGFSTHHGTVTAASDWGGPAERKRVVPALGGSWEELFHERGVARFLVDASGFPGRRLQRAIGVIYRPETERFSHYFHAQLADQFDAMIHIDETSALEPLEPASEWTAAELPETYPFGV